MKCYVEQHVSKNISFCQPILAKYVLCKFLSIDEMQPYMTHFAILFLL